MQTLWREFEDAEAVLDSLPDDSPDREADGLLPNSDPRVIRFEDAQERIVAARPTDLTGLVAQLRYYQRLVKDSEPNEAEAAMFDHVIDQMAVLAAQPTGPLSSAF